LAFKLSGIGLSDVDQAQVKAIKSELSKLGNEFSNRVVDATDRWNLNVIDEQRVAGIPAPNLDYAKQLAEAKQLDGWLFTLDIPQYLAVMTYADDRDLRRELHEAFASRASPVNTLDSELNNAPTIERTLELRAELSKLLGYANYAELSLATKMAESTDQVLGFLNELAEKSLATAQAEFSELQSFAQANGLEGGLKPWDVAYYSELLKQSSYQVSAQEVKAYFPVDSVVAGLFDVVNKLFDVSFERDEVDVWHEDASFYWLVRNGQRIAGFYFDLFAREGKRGGAWMADARVRVSSPLVTQLPIAFLNCNFAPPTKDTPSLLTHDDVTTLFHEFGHGLHHMLTQVTVADVSGINGVAWDAVELPSQWLENWCWDRDTLKSMSRHYQSGDSLPDELLDKMLRAKNFQSAMAMCRQLEFALFDFELHANPSWNRYSDVMAHLDAIRSKVCVLPVSELNHFPCSFSHIFAGGYAAGYYSYKWAEVLSADAFGLFEELGLYNREAAERFELKFLCRGGSKPAAELYRDFRGRDAKVDYLLRHSGIEVEHV
ncbi:MAG: M3 family metallopeptidase, partial [Gammaproteobacteria bacterium]|nr:M3 family metallopeptidase [Gammaproteobacteria bacterium]